MSSEEPEAPEEGLEEEEESPAEVLEEAPEEGVDPNEDPSEEPEAEGAEEGEGEVDEAVLEEDVVPPVVDVDEELEIREETAEEMPVVKQVSWEDPKKPPPPVHSGPIPPGVLKGLVSGMWASRQMLDTDANKQIVMKTTLRELIVYCMFLLTIVYMTFTPYSDDYYRLRSGIIKIYPHLPKIVTGNQDFWYWIQGEFLDGLYYEQWYNPAKANGQVYRFKCPDGDITAPCSVLPPDRNVMYENRMLGVPRIRQLRTSNSSCPIYSDFSNAIKKCHAPYTYATEDTSDRYPQPLRRVWTSESAWKYQNATVTGSTSVHGLMATYSGAGSTQNLHYQRNVTENILKELNSLLWTDQGTRFVIIDFTVYNANVNLFGMVQIKFEFLASGGCIPDIQVQVAKFLKYNESADYILMGVEILFAIFTLYYLIEEILELKSNGFSAHFADSGNVLDIVVIGASVTQIILNLATVGQVHFMLEDLTQFPFDYADFSALGSQTQALAVLSAFNLLIAWVKVFKYLSFNKTMTQLSGTLSSCAKDLTGFTVMFLIIFFSFAMLGYLLFGTQIDDYKDIIQACYSLFRTILGDFNFTAIEQSDYVFGPIYFLSYIFFVFFVLLNVFLAIINDTYGVVKADIKKRKPTLSMGDFFMVGVNKVKTVAGVRDRSIEVENAVKLAAEDDGFVTFQELRENLKHSDFSDLEIDLLFDQLKEDPEMRMLLKDEEQLSQEELEQSRLEALQGIEEAREEEDSRPKSGKEARLARSARIKEALAGGQPLESDRFYGLQDRLSRMEATVGPITIKIDRLLERLDEMRKSKQRKWPRFNI